MLDIDVLSLTEEEAQYLFDQLHKRRVMMDAEARLTDILSEYHDARDGQAPDPATATVEDYPTYVAPTGVHNAYIEGRIIFFNGKLYRARRTGVAHSPDDAPQEWQEVFLIDGEITDEQPTPPGPDEWDPMKTYYQNPDNSPKIVVKKDGNLYELISASAAPGFMPGDPNMWAVWKLI